MFHIDTILRICPILYFFLKLNKKDGFQNLLWIGGLIILVCVMKSSLDGIFVQ